MRVARNPDMKSIKRNPHRKPFKVLDNYMTEERKAAVLKAARRADTNQSHYTGGTFVDYTRSWFDGMEVVK